MAAVVARLSRPGGNITGFINIESSLVGKWLDLLREIAPQVSRVAFMINPKTAPYARYYLENSPSVPLAHGLSVRFFVTAGALISYGVDLANTLRGAASYVDPIFWGAKPDKLPVPTKFELIINLKTTKELGGWLRAKRPKTDDPLREGNAANLGQRLDNPVPQWPGAYRTRGLYLTDDGQHIGVRCLLVCRTCIHIAYDDKFAAV